jgi:shikimate dehydrogenase
MSFLSLLMGSFFMPAGDSPTVAMVEAVYRHHGRGRALSEIAM